MKLQLGLLSLTFILATSAIAATKGYQVTGPVIDVTDSSITIEKKKGENWVIAKPAGVKVTGGELKKGDKATVYYSMAAEEIEVKAAKAEKVEKKK